jgi:ubiquinone/menaquinone biosynthesis C-methylase UbiE
MDKYGPQRYGPSADVPPPYTVVGRHDMMPNVTHDEVARFNFLTNLVKHLSTRVLPGNAVAYEQRARPRYEAETGHAPADRREVRKAMSTDPYYKTWSALRLNAMEMRQQAGRSVVLRQLDELNDKARRHNQNKDTLQLDPNVPIPRYIGAVDNHLMPGSYYTEVTDEDVSAAANYDVGIYVTTQGLFGRYTDGAGHGIVKWLNEHHPALDVQRILDMGCGIGHNSVPVARGFPDADMYAVDVAAPMLRYGHARAASLGATNLIFKQGNVEALDFPDGHFDVVFSTMFVHETSYKAIHRIMAEARRLLRPGGIHFHLEQPPFHGMPPFEQFLRDWDAYYNNEPFWSTVHSMRMPDVLEKAGFKRNDIFETTICAVVDESIFPKAGDFDFGRGAVWYTFGAVKHAS